MATFADVKTILNKIMQGSVTTLGHKVNLQNKHNEPSFPDFYGDFTNAQLKAGMSRGLQLIQPEIIPPPGTVGTQGDQANIVKALKGLWAPTFRQMPGGGPVMSDLDIATIVDWINHGCPD
jgi:hypothetical protein